MAKIRCRWCKQVSHQTNENWDPTKIPDGSMFSLIPGTVPYEHKWGTFHSSHDKGQALPCPYCEGPYAEGDNYIKTFIWENGEAEEAARKMMAANMPKRLILDITGIDPDEELPPKGVVCPVCGKQFKSEAGMLQHHRIKHIERGT